MKLIIGMMDNRMKTFIKNNEFNSKILLISKMCNVKTIKEDVEIIIPFGIINENYIVSNTLVHIYELIISLNVKKITYGNILNKNVLEKISNEFNIPVHYIDLKSINKRQKI